MLCIYSRSIYCLDKHAIFNSISNKQLHILWSNKFFWLVCIIFIFITSLIAGSYPALYLSSFEPIKVLKGTFQAGRLATLPRKLLVVVQFTVSIALIIGTMIVYRQIQYAKERPVGYSQDGLVNIYLDNNNIHEHFDAIFDELTQTGAVVSMTEAGSPTTAVWGLQVVFPGRVKIPIYLLILDL